MHARTFRLWRVRPNDPTGKSAKTCPALVRKIFRLTRRANQRYASARLTRYEGRCARHERAVGCGGRGSCSRRTQPIADGEVVWSWRPGVKAVSRRRRGRAAPALSTADHRSTSQLLPGDRLSCHRHFAGLVPRNLAPASGRQDHTTSPSASSCARQSQLSRPPHLTARS